METQKKYTHILFFGLWQKNCLFVSSILLCWLFGWIDDDDDISFFCSYNSQLYSLKFFILKELIIKKKKMNNRFFLVLDILTIKEHNPLETTNLVFIVYQNLSRYLCGLKKCLCMCMCNHNADKLDVQMQTSKNLVSYNK